MPFWRGQKTKETRKKGGGGGFEPSCDLHSAKMQDPISRLLPPASSERSQTCNTENDPGGTYFQGRDLNLKATGNILESCPGATSQQGQGKRLPSGGGECHTSAERHISAS